VNDSIVWGAQLLELDMANLYTTSELEEDAYFHRQMKTTPKRILDFGAEQVFV
jgi:hypothetical protein